MSRSVIGRPKKRIPGSVDPGVLSHDNSPATCSGVVIPASIAASNGPVTIASNGELVNVNAFDPWDGIFTNLAPCYWESFPNAQPDTWLGRSFFGPSLEYGISLPASIGWVIRANTSTPLNPGMFSYYNKTTGSTPIGIYTACLVDGSPAPLQFPQTLTAS